MKFVYDFVSFPWLYFIKNIFIYGFFIGITLFFSSLQPHFSFVNFIFYIFVFRLVLCGFLFFQHLFRNLFREKLRDNILKLLLLILINVFSITVSYILKDSKDEFFYWIIILIYFYFAIIFTNIFDEYYKIFHILNSSLILLDINTQVFVIFVITEFFLGDFIFKFFNFKFLQKIVYKIKLFLCANLNKAYTQISESKIKINHKNDFYNNMCNSLHFLPTDIIKIILEYNAIELNIPDFGQISCLFGDKYIYPLFMQLFFEYGNSKNYYINEINSWFNCFEILHENNNLWLSENLYGKYITTYKNDIYEFLPRYYLNKHFNKCKWLLRDYDNFRYCAIRDKIYALTGENDIIVYEYSCSNYYKKKYVEEFRIITNIGYDFANYYNYENFFCVFDNFIVFTARFDNYYNLSKKVNKYIVIIHCMTNNVTKEWSHYNNDTVFVCHNTVFIISSNNNIIFFDIQDLFSIAKISNLKFQYEYYR